jgi:hypothetical protein
MPDIVIEWRKSEVPSKKSGVSNETLPEGEQMMNPGFWQTPCRFERPPSLAKLGVPVAPTAEAAARAKTKTELINILSFEIVQLCKRLTPDC